MVPPGVTTIVFAVLLMLTCGTGGRITVVVHGGSVSPGSHPLPVGGTSVAVFVTCAGGVGLTVAVTV